MKPALLICGYGPGIGHAVAERFGQAGHPVHLVARDGQKLASAVHGLSAQGIQARGTACDLGDTAALQALLNRLRTEAEVGLLHWNAFVDVDGELLGASPEVLSRSLTLRVVSYLSMVQGLLPMFQERQGAVLATSGVMGFQRPEIDAFARDFGVLAVSVAAQHKANALLAPALAARGVYLAEVVVSGFVRKTPAEAQHAASIDPADVAKQFWQMLQARTVHSQSWGGTLKQG